MSRGVEHLHHVLGATDVETAVGVDDRRGVGLVGLVRRERGETRDEGTGRHRHAGHEPRVGLPVDRREVAGGADVLSVVVDRDVPNAAGEPGNPVEVDSAGVAVETGGVPEPGVGITRGPVHEIELTGDIDLGTRKDDLADHRRTAFGLRHEARHRRPGRRIEHHDAGAGCAVDRGEFATDEQVAVGRDLERIDGAVERGAERGDPRTAVAVECREVGLALDGGSRVVGVTLNPREVATDEECVADLGEVPDLGLRCRGTGAAAHDAPLLHRRRVERVEIDGGDGTRGGDDGIVGGRRNRSGTAEGRHQQRHAGREQGNSECRCQRPGPCPHAALGALAVPIATCPPVFRMNRILIPRNALVFTVKTFAARCQTRCAESLGRRAHHDSRTHAVPSLHGT